MTLNGNNQPTSTILDLVATGKARLMREVLYELQTGGGIALDAAFKNKSPAKGDKRAAIAELIVALKQGAQAAPARAAEILAPYARRVLDVGAGHAPWSLAMAARCSSAAITAVDLPSEIEALRAAVGNVGQLDRFLIQEMNVFDEEFREDERFDLIIAGNLFHVFGHKKARVLVHRLCQWITPSGAIAIIDQVLDESPDWTRWAALYATGALHCAPGGGLFSIREYSAWFNEVGKWNITVSALCQLPPLTIIVASRAN